MKDVIQTQNKIWNLSDILLVLIIVFGGESIIYKILEFSFSWQKSPLVLTLILHLTQSLLLVMLTLALVVYKYDYSLADFGLIKVNFGKNINYGVMGGVIIWLIVTFSNNFIYSIATKFFQVEPPTQQAIQSLLSSDNLFLFVIHSLLIVILAPITEEIFFRGFIYPYCKRKLDAKGGMLISGLIFAVAHFNFWIFIPTFIGGVILAFIYERTNSLYPAMIAHSTWNGIVIFLVYFLWELGG